jgi:hypothetical protein
MLVQTRRNKQAALRLMRKLLKKYGFVPDQLTDELRSYAAAASHLGIAKRHERGRWSNNRAGIRISQPDEGRGRCKGSSAWDPRNDFSQCMQQPIILSTSSAISPQQERTEPSGPHPCRRGAKSSPPHDFSASNFQQRDNAVASAKAVKINVRLRRLSAGALIDAVVKPFAMLMRPIVGFECLPTPA